MDGNDSSTGPDVASGLMHQLSAWMKERDRDVVEHWHGAALVEISVTSPRGPEYGQAVIMNDGSFTLERRFRLAADGDVQAIAQLIGICLEEDLGRISALPAPGEEDGNDAGNL